MTAVQDHWTGAISSTPVTSIASPSLPTVPTQKNERFLEVGNSPGLRSLNRERRNPSPITALMFSVWAAATLPTVRTRWEMFLTRRRERLGSIPARSSAQRHRGTAAQTRALAVPEKTRLSYPHD